MQGQQGAEQQDVGRDDQSVCLVVPMFNEEERGSESIGALLDYIADKPEGSQLVMADDGSTDRTVEVVTERINASGNPRALVLPLPHAGKGATVRAGLLRSRSDVAAFCDVDLATPLGELDRIIAAAADGWCLAIGSRATPDADLQEREERRREVAGRAFNRLVRSNLCPGIEDTQCGAKAAPTPIWRSILAHSRQDAFAWDVEIIALALRLGVTVDELGIEWHHDDRTRVRVLRDGIKMVSAVPAISLAVWRLRGADTTIPLRRGTTAVDSVERAS